MPRFLLVLLLAIGAHVARAEHAVVSELQPATYASPSGAYVLSVDPSERKGQGPADYVLRHDRTIVWSGRRAFTFQEAVVADDGTAGGYAYSAGLEARTDNFADVGDFSIAVLGRDGKVLVHERLPRRHSSELHQYPQPQGKGVFLRQAAGLFVVRVTDEKIDDGKEVWWHYAPDGTLARKSTPQRQLPFDGTLLSARQLAGAPLTLVDAWTDKGAAFALLDAKESPVWSAEVPGDFVHEKVTWHELTNGAAILDVATPGRFALRHVTNDTRVDYAIAANAESPTGWNVRETKRTRWSKPVRARLAIERAPERTLKLLGEIRLDTGARKPTEVREVNAFAIDDRGRIGVLEGCACSQRIAPALVVVEANGALVARVPLPEGVGSGTTLLAWVTANRWLVVDTATDSKQPSRSWWIDIVTQEVVRAKGFTQHRAIELASLGKAGVAMLVTEHRENDADAYAVEAFALDGSLRWAARDTGQETGLSGANDVAVTANGTIVTAGRELVAFASDGRRLGRIPYRGGGLLARFVDISSTHMRVEAIGNDLLVHEGGDPPITRVSLEGRASTFLEPRFHDGRRVPPRGNVQVAPDGRLWTSDGEALLQLSGDGVVEHVVGNAPTDLALGTVAALHVGPDAIHALDARTGVVHVFDHAGARLRACTPDTSDYEGNLYDASLTVDSDGRTYVQHRNAGEQVLHYGADCRRIGVIDAAPDEVSEEWVARRNAPGFWILGYERAYLLDGPQDTGRPIDRMADRRWLSDPDAAAVASDGSITILSPVDNAAWSLASTKSTFAVTTYSATGAPLHTWELPETTRTDNGAIAYENDRVAVAARDDTSTVVFVTDATGAPLFRTRVDQRNAGVYLVEGSSGTELWIFDGAHTIRRHALPKS